MAFDPYYEWLGIPPEEQPADCYQLLGIRRFETNSTVIDNAAERQLLMLKTRQNGPHSLLTQKIMNEVSSARIHLLNPGKRAKYDAELRRHQSVNPLPQPPLAPPLAPPLFGDQSEPEFDDGPTEVPPTPRLLQPKHRNTISARRKKAARSIGRSSWGPLLPAMVAGAAIVTIVVIALVILDNEGSPDTQNSSVVKQPLSTRSSSHGNRSLPPPLPPTAHPSPENEVQSEKSDGQSRQQRSLSSTQESKVNDPETPMPENELDHMAEHKPAAMNRVVTPADQDNRHSDVAIGVASSNIKEGFREAPAANANRRRDGLTPFGGLGVNENHSTETDTRNGAESGSAGGKANRAKQIDLLAGYLTRSSSDLLIGRVQLSSVENCRITIEEYCHPSERPKFRVDEAVVENDGQSWPLFFVGTPPPSDSDVERAASEVSCDKLVATFELDRTQLFMRFSEAIRQDQLQALSYCCCSIDAGGQSSTFQLRRCEEVAPLIMTLDGSGKPYDFGEVPPSEFVDPERIVLTVTRVNAGSLPPTPTENLQLRLGKEQTLWLDKERDCELLVRFSENRGRFEVFVLPRYVLNNRHLKLDQQAIKEDLVRYQANLTKNQQELAAAQTSLKDLPSQISRVRNITPRNRAEAAFQGNQLSQLGQLGKNMQSRIRRRVKAASEMLQTIQRLKGVLKFVEETPNQVTLHFEIGLEGKASNLILLQTHDTSG